MSGPTESAQIDDVLPEDRFIARPDGRRLRFWSQGSGDVTVVCLHGLGFTQLDWLKLAGRLIPDTTVVSYDRAGLGESDPHTGQATIEDTIGDLTALLDEVSPRQPVVLVGHSWGGLVARLFAHQHTDRVAGLLLIDPTPDRMARFGTRILRKQQQDLAKYHEPWQCGEGAALLEAANDGILAVLKSFWAKHYSTTAQRYLRDNLTRPDYWIRSLGDAQTVPSGISAMRALARKDQRFGFPITVLSSDAAPSTPWFMARMMTWGLRWHRAMAAAGSPAKHQQVSGASHYIHFDAPDVVLAECQALVSHARARR